MSLYPTSGLKSAEFAPLAATAPSQTKISYTQHSDSSIVSSDNSRSCLSQIRDKITNLLSSIWGWITSWFRSPVNTQQTNNPSSPASTETVSTVQQPTLFVETPVGTAPVGTSQIIWDEIYVPTPAEPLVMVTATPVEHEAVTQQPTTPPILPPVVIERQVTKPPEQTPQQQRPEPQKAAEPNIWGTNSQIDEGHDSIFFRQY